MFKRLFNPKMLGIVGGLYTLKRLRYQSRIFCMKVAPSNFILIYLFFSFLQLPKLRDLARGQQENKIRRYSPPGRIFEFFATVRHKPNQNLEPTLFMNTYDLFRAIVPYNYSDFDTEIVKCHFLCNSHSNRKRMISTANLW